MEANTNRYVITPVKGISNTPSDLTCDDEQLSICEGMTLDNGELKPIQSPNITLDNETINGKLLYVHDYNNLTRYISYDDTSKKLFAKWKKQPVSSYQKIAHITADLRSDGKYDVRWKLDGVCGYYQILQKVKYTNSSQEETHAEFSINYNGGTSWETLVLTEAEKDSIVLDGDVVCNSATGIADEYEYITFVSWLDTEYEEQTIAYIMTGVNHISSIGNTLIVNRPVGNVFFLWKNNKYNDIGEKIPEPDFHFELSTIKDDDEPTKAKLITSSIDVTGMAYESDYKIIVNADKDLSWEDAICGLYAEVKNMCAQKKAFVLPFFVRGAVEMYDGSYIYISNPILMIPNIKEGNVFHFTRWNVSDWGLIDVSCTMIASTLKVKQTTDYSNYKDLVKGVSVFVTKPTDMFEFDKSSKVAHDGNQKYVIPSRVRIAMDAMSAGSEKIYDTGEHWGAYNIWEYEDDNKLFRIVYNNNSGEFPNPSITPSYARETAYTPFASISQITSAPMCTFYPLRHLTQKEMIEKLKTSHIYFKLCDIGINAEGTEFDTTEYIGTSVVENIETQTKLTKDDYYGWTNTIPSYIATLNRRLLMSGIQRSFFNGFSQHTSVCAPYTGTLGELKADRIYVKIETESGERVVSVAPNTSNNYFEMLCNGFWFFYPDTRAKHFWVVNGATSASNSDKILYEGELEESSQLNGAFHFKELPNKIYESQSPTSKGNLNICIKKTPEFLDNYLIQSEVDNPFYTSASSYVRVGSGDIIGVSALTTALSNDAFAVSTTICFTTQGIWALISGSTGEFTSVPPAFSREVCSNRDSITMVDGMVFFVSKKGLMCIAGAAQNLVVCVSEQLNGVGKKDFIEFAQNCKIAYDYKESCLYMYQEDNSKVWVYNIKHKTFSVDNDFFCDSGKKIFSVAPNYPDYVVQSNDSKLHTLTGKVERDDDTNQYSGHIVSRPMKLGGSVVFKSLRRVKHIMTLNGDASFTFKIYASNDLKEWTELTSIYGKGYKYFKYSYQFANLKANDTFSALMLEMQTRTTDKPE